MTDITRNNTETCQICTTTLPDGDTTAYITQTKPHYFFFLCDSCEALAEVARKARTDAQSNVPPS